MAAKKELAEMDGRDTATDAKSKYEMNVLPQSGRSFCIQDAIIPRFCFVRRRCKNARAFVSGLLYYHADIIINYLSLR